jgi:hypothetical protein
MEQMKEECVKEHNNEDNVNNEDDQDDEDNERNKDKEDDESNEDNHEDNEGNKDDEDNEDEEDDDNVGTQVTSALSLAKIAAEELVRVAYFSFDTILAESTISFEPSPPSMAHLRRLRRPAELVNIPNYQKNLFDMPPFISNIRFPLGYHKPKVSPPHTRLSRSSRAFNMAEDLLRRVQHGVGIVLEGTSFNHPTFSAQQNYVAGYSIILSALMALNSRFPNRIAMILVKGED